MANLAIRKKVVSQNHLPPPPNFVFCILEKLSTRWCACLPFCKFSPKGAKMIEFRTIFSYGN